MGTKEKWGVGGWWVAVGVAKCQHVTLKCQLLGQVERVKWTRLLDVTRLSIIQIHILNYI